MTEKRIDSSQNAFIKHLVKLQKSRDYRRDHRLCIVEGFKMCQEASNSQSLETLIIEESLSLPVNIKAAKIIRTPMNIIQKISCSQHPEPILGEALLPDFSLKANWNRLLVLDRVCDPGNLGQLLRTAAAFGWDAVCLLEGSADPFNPKALAAARGATFKLNISEKSWESLKKTLDANSAILTAADLKGVPFNEFSAPSQMALVLGNEAEGISKEVSCKSLSLTIPMRASSESLNVAAAGAILMQHFQMGTNL